MIRLPKVKYCGGLGRRRPVVASMRGAHPPYPPTFPSPRPWPVKLATLCQSQRPPHRAVYYLWNSLVQNLSSIPGGVGSLARSVVSSQPTERDLFSTVRTGNNFPLDRKKKPQESQEIKQTKHNRKQINMESRKIRTKHSLIITAPKCALFMRRRLASARK